MKTFVFISRIILDLTFLVFGFNELMGLHLSEIAGAVLAAPARETSNQPPSGLPNQ